MKLKIQLYFSTHTHERDWDVVWRGHQSGANSAHHREPTRAAPPRCALPRAKAQRRESPRTVQKPERQKKDLLSYFTSTDHWCQVIASVSANGNL